MIYSENGWMDEMDGWMGGWVVDGWVGALINKWFGR